MASSARKRLSDNVLTVGRALAAARRALKLQQRELAARLGVSPRTLSRWENDALAPPPAKRVAIVQALATAPLEHVLQLAQTLGVPVRTETAALAEASPAPPGGATGATGEGLRAALDSAIFFGADELDVSPRRLRRIVYDVLREIDRIGASPRTAHEALAIRPRAPGEDSTSV